MPLPDPAQPRPIPAHPRVALLQPFAEGRDNVSVGDWTYADDPAGHADVFRRRARTPAPAIRGGGLAALEALAS